ncbi:hypothetical protein A4A49_22275 [Nicotiana attenuata]|uniref:Uncharacterized protein n=1 Tax=Nicotiana attenuata TaxID=49451 RepID=A0A314L8I2_NICAT|nr:hypothetical protein A4A49_22275 [Nicotiana attenuata]
MEVLDRFSGSGNPESWLFRAERYFTYLGFTEKDWLPLPSFYLDGEALNWFNWLFRNKQFFDWTHFKAKFAQHFRRQTAIYSVRRFVGSAPVSFDYISTFPIVSQSTMVSPFPVSSLFPKTSAFEAAYATENLKANHMFDNLPVKYENVDSLTLITGSNIEIVNLEDIEALQIWNANSVEVVDLVHEPSAIIEDHVLDEISLVVVSSDLHDLNAPVHEGESSISFQTKVHTEVLDDTTGSDDWEEENSRDSTTAGVFDKYPQWDTLDFLVFTSQGIVVSNSSLRFDVIEFPFDDTIWFGTIPWLRFLLSKSRNCARGQKIQRGLQALAENYSKLSPDIRVDKVDGHLLALFGLAHATRSASSYSIFDPSPYLDYPSLPMLVVFIIAHKYGNCICSSNDARDSSLPTSSYVDKGFDNGWVFKVASGTIDMSVEHNGNSINSCAMFKLLGEFIANSFMCSVNDTTIQIEEQYIINQLWSFSSGRALELSVLHHALTFTMVLWINETIIIGDAPLKFVVAFTKKPSLGINSTFSISYGLFMFDIHEVLVGCYQFLAGQSKLPCSQLGLGLAHYLEVIPCLLSAYNHDQLLHRVLQLVSRQLFNTENAHEDALLKFIGALAKTSVHYTTLVHVVSAIPLALSCRECATIFFALNNSIPNNNLGHIARTRIMEFREVLGAGADAELCVLESHAGGSFTVTRNGFGDNLGRGTKIAVIKSTVEQHEGVEIFFNIFAFMVAQLHMQEGTNCIFSQTYKRVLDLDVATVNATFSISEVVFPIYFTREYLATTLEMNCHIFYNDMASVKTNWSKQFHRQYAPVLDTYTLVWCELRKNSFDFGNFIDEQNLFDGVYILDLNLEDKVSSCGYFEWIDEELPRRAVMVIKDLKTKLDAAKVERNNLRNKIYLMEQATMVQRGSKNLFDEMEDVMTVERHTLKMKLDEMEKFQLVEAEKASKIEVKVKKMRNIILVSWALLFALVVVGMMK